MEFFEEILKLYQNLEKSSEGVDLVFKLPLKIFFNLKKANVEKFCCAKNGDFTNLIIYDQFIFNFLLEVYKNKNNEFLAKIVEIVKKICDFENFEEIYSNNNKSAKIAEEGKREFYNCGEFDE